MNCLFLGGPVDGMWRNVDPYPSDPRGYMPECVRIPLYHNFRPGMPGEARPDDQVYIETAEYRKTIWRGPSGDYVVYQHHDVKDGFARLMEGYIGAGPRVKLDHVPGGFLSADSKDYGKWQDLYCRDGEVKGVLVLYDRKATVST